MANQFTDNEWNRINDTLNNDPDKYGFPKRTYGTALLGTFNIRKLGSTRNRSPKTWEFLAKVCRQFDLIAIQEIMDDLSGINRIMEHLGTEFGLVVSDKTGVFPGDSGLGERLGFIFRWATVVRGEVISDITYDRSKVIELMAENYDVIHEAMEPYAKKFQDYKAGLRNRPKNVHLPAFLSFIRQPYCVSFKLKGYPGSKTYEFMAVNGHLHFGDYMSDRRQEFHALMQWIIERVKKDGKAYYPNFVLLADLNLDMDNPATDRARVDASLKSYDKDGNPSTAPSDQINVNFPFLDVHPSQNSIFRTNARLSETYDHIGLFFKESGDIWPTHQDNPTMGSQTIGCDYGVFNFAELFRESLGITPTIPQMTTAQKKAFFGRFEYKVSDHMPIWLRLPLPTS